MHVLHVMASGARGGGADHLLGLLPALAGQGVRCSAAVGADGPLLQALSAQRVPACAVQLMGFRGSPRSVADLATVVANTAPDLVHLHGTRAAYFGTLARAWARGAWPRLYTAHGLAYRKRRRLGFHGAYLAAEWLACQADAVISVSARDLDDLGQRGFLRRCLALHVPNAVDGARFVPRDRAGARRHLGLPRDGFFVGTTARLVEQKNVSDLLDAMVHVPEARVVVIGDGPLRGELQNHPLARAGRAVFLGERDDVAACLPALDVFALTSLWEGEPIALLEAMACGLPCVATATGGAEEILAAKKPAAGVLVPVRQPARLGEALRTLASDVGERRRLGRLARARVLDRSVAAQAARVAALYEQVCSDAARAS